MRAHYRAQLTTPLAVPAPGLPGIASMVGLAFDMRLRLAYTATPAVAESVRVGVELCDQAANQAHRPHQTTWAGITALGRELTSAIVTAVEELRLDDRDTPLAHDTATERHLARLLLAASWFEVAYRSALTSYPATPAGRHANTLAAAGSLEQLLALVPEPAIVDVTALVTAAAHGPTAALRAQSTSRQCYTGVEFAGSPDIGAADCDLIVDGLLIETKVLAQPTQLPIRIVHQLLGYTLLDYHDRYRIDRIGIYAARVPALVHWPLEQVLDQLGATAALPELRQRCKRLAERVPLDLVPSSALQRDALNLLLAEAGALPRGRCHLCGRPLPRRRLPGMAKPPLRYCSARCRHRAGVVRRAFSAPPATRSTGTRPSRRPGSVSPARVT